MKINLTLSGFIVSALLCTFIVSSCGKHADAPGNTIQQGDSTIEIIALHPSPQPLLIRYNNIINAAIHVTVTFYLKDGQQHDIPITIPAGYRDIQQMWGDDYVNEWTYTYASNGDTLTNPAPPQPAVGVSWDVDHVAITAVSCADKKYGFKVMTGLDEWNYYHPTDPKTVISFVSNKDTVTYSDYDFKAGTTIFRKDSSVYDLYFFSYAFFMASARANYPLQTGTTINMPYLVYHWNGRNFGSQPDGPEEASNGSTLQLKVTNVTDKTYDATFRGKLWSSHQPDTLVISYGVIKNALLPVTEIK